MKYWMNVYKCKKLKLINLKVDFLDNDKRGKALPVQFFAQVLSI